MLRASRKSVSQAISESGCTTVWLMDRAREQEREKERERGGGKMDELMWGLNLLPFSHTLCLPHTRYSCCRDVVALLGFYLCAGASEISGVLLIWVVSSCRLVARTADSQNGIFLTSSNLVCGDPLFLSLHLDAWWHAVLGKLTCFCEWLKGATLVSHLTLQMLVGVKE